MQYNKHIGKVWYSEVYLKSSHWNNLRRRKLDSVFPVCCEICKSKRLLQVHHKTYKRFPECPLSDLQILCEDCHQETHHPKIKTPSPKYKGKSFSDDVLKAYRLLLNFQLLRKSERLELKVLLSNLKAFDEIPDCTPNRKNIIIQFDYVNSYIIKHGLR